MYHMKKPLYVEGFLHLVAGGTNLFNEQIYSIGA